MSKGLEVLENLDKLEECAYVMNDLTMSNWIDLANSESELDEKIVSGVEEIKLELFKGKQVLIKAQEQEKVLKVMKDKWVNVAVLIHSKTVEEYNNNAHTPYNLTKEEYELLKEVLDNE